MKNIFFRTLSAAALSVLTLPAFAQKTITVAAGQSAQAAIDSASTGDTVQLDPSGTFTEHLTIIGKSITLDGGSASTGSLPGAILKPSNTGPAISISGAAASATVISHLNIQGGGLPANSGGVHGVISITNASPSIQYDRIGGYCAGVLATNSNVAVAWTLISGTLSSGCPSEEGTGSAIVISGADPNAAKTAAILGNILTANVNSLQYSGDKGGGAAINITNQTRVDIDRNVIDNNKSAGYGGAIYTASTPSLYISNNIIYSNTGLSGGLDLVIPGSSVGDVQGVLINNTIAYNTATSSNAGSDVYIGGNLAQYQMVNNIIVGNGNGQYAVNCGSTYAGQTITPLVLDHNDFYSVPSSGNKPIGGACTSPTGTFGNISADPLFADVSSTALSNGQASFQLQQGSPAIDTGNNSGLPISGSDFWGAERYFDATSKGYAVIDMGGYEYGAFLTTNVFTGPQLVLEPSTWTPTVGASVTLNAYFGQISTSGTGVITFYEDGTSIGTGTIVPATSTAPAIATFTVSSLAAGTHNFTATWPGDSNFKLPLQAVYINLLASAANATATSTTLTSSLNPSNVGDSVTLTAKIAALTGSSTPTGKVYFIDGANSLGNATVDSTGSASVTVSNFTAGTHSITAAFVASGSFGGSTGSLTQVVNPAALIPTTSANNLLITPIFAGKTTPLEVLVTSTSSTSTIAPTGTVTFLDGSGRTIGSAAVTAVGTTMAKADITSPVLVGGANDFSCVYSGDSVYSGSTCPTWTITATAATSALTFVLNNAAPRALTAFTGTAHLTANGQPVSGATITTSTGGSAVTNANGDATLTFSLAAGPYTITASVAATTSYTAAQAGASVTVLKNDTSGTLIATPTTAYETQTVDVVATLADLTGTPSPSGSIVLMEGSTNIAGANLPAAVLTSNTTTVDIPLNTLSVGTHTLTVTYLPDTNSNAPATTIGPVTITVLPSSFTVATDPTSISIQTEHHKSLNVIVSSVGSFSGNVQLACATPLPPVLTCTFGQSTVNVAQSSTASTSLKLETDAVPNFYASSTQRTPWPQNRVPVFAITGLFATVALARRRRHIRNLMFALAACALFTTISGCSGHYPDHTPPGTYDIVITATGTQASGAKITQTTHLALTVTP
ncbi:Ig-like domain repeat protein [Granulicella cerasi]|uniref:Ig-like domain repeat protein n=1 Tax=Granulicella cerasi TaxID=741063 RepID=A0ABW1ZA27_9BACT|nr:Ig-like domain repeat protein [Granulicella cerasi]